LQRYRKSQADALVQFLKLPGSAKERLKAALEQLIRLDLEGPIKKGCMAVNAAAELSTSDESVARLVRDMFDRTESALTHLVEEGRSRGEFRRDIDARSLASLLFNTVLGLRIAGLVADTPERLQRTVDAIVRVL
jgi:TetR/AcrR family transcriptional repressor of nem operon